MGAVKINGTTSGSVSLEAPATGSDVTLTLPATTMDLGAELASKLPIAGGKILQIVRATDSTQRTTSSTSFVDASISVTITPQKNDSAILIIWTYFGANPNNAFVIGAISDNSNNLIAGGQFGAIGGSNAAAVDGYMNMIAYSTPATTSATTYKGRFRVNAGTGSIKNDVTTGQMFAIEVSA